MTRRTVWGFGFLLLAALCSAGCKPQSDAKYRIAVIPKGTSHQFWRSVHAGALQARDELAEQGIKVDIIWKGPTKENNTNGQKDVVKNFITKRVDGIILAPNHSQSLVDEVEEANDEGIPVVIFDSGLAEGPEIVSYVATDNYKGGALAAQRLAEALGESGQVILLRYRAGSESTEQREQGFLDELKENHPQIEVISSNEHGEESKDSAMEKMNQVLQTHEAVVDGVFAVCEPNANGTLEALGQRGLAGKVKFVAFDPSDELIQGMKDGAVAGIVLQDPVKMGYESVMAMVKHLEGEKDVPNKIGTGEYVATPENMNEPDMNRLLHPKLADE